MKKTIETIISEFTYDEHGNITSSKTTTTIDKDETTGCVDATTECDLDDSVLLDSAIEVEESPLSKITAAIMLCASALTLATAWMNFRGSRGE